MKWSHKPLPGVNNVPGHPQLCREYWASLGYRKHNISTESDKRGHMALRERAEGVLEALSSGGLCFSSHPTAAPSYATDLVVCVALGCDMFDCVYPTRTAVSPG